MNDACLHPANQRCPECLPKTFLFDGLPEGTAPADEPGWLEAAAEAKRGIAEPEAEREDRAQT
jgi:hypothetical protein